MKRRSYWLPNGKLTTSYDRYIRAWRRLGKVVGRAFGGVLNGFDPDLWMFDRKTKRSYMVPVWQALKLQEMEKQ